MNKDKKLQFNVVFKPEKKGVLLCWCLFARLCKLWKNSGRSKKMIADAIDGYIFSMKKEEKLRYFAYHYKRFSGVDFKKFK